jgi:hypothetical protein
MKRQNDQINACVCECACVCVCVDPESYDEKHTVNRLSILIERVGVGANMGLFIVGETSVRL